MEHRKRALCVPCWRQATKLKLCLPLVEDPHPAVRFKAVGQVRYYALAGIGEPAVRDVGRSQLSKCLKTETDPEVREAIDKAVKEINVAQREREQAKKELKRKGRRRRGF